MWPSFRLFLSVLAGVATLVGTVTAGCDDEGGASNLDRCRSWFGNRTLEWRGGDWSPIFPRALGIAVGIGVWWWFGRGALSPKR